MASDIYAEQMTKLFFPSLVTYMSSGPVLVMQLAREKAVSYLRELTGPPNPARARITHPNWSAIQHVCRLLYTVTPNCSITHANETVVHL